MLIESLRDYYDRNNFHPRDKYNPKINIEPKLGKIYYANLLINFDGIFSYKHPVLVLKIDEVKKTFLCVPLTTSKKSAKNNFITLPKDVTGRVSYLLFDEIRTLSFISIYSSNIGDLNKKPKILSEVVDRTNRALLVDKNNFNNLIDF